MNVPSVAQCPERGADAIAAVWLIDVHIRPW